MTFLRLFLRGIRDLFEQLLSLCMYSLLWWIAVATVVLAPPATVTLFSMADPRRQVTNPEFGDAVAVFRSSFRRGWGIFLWTVPLITILIWNTYYFGGTNETLSILVPLWLLMSIALLMLGLYAFSVAGTMESGVKNAFRGAAYLLVSRPFVSLFLIVSLLVLSLLMTVTVVPMVLFGPALIASIVNRFTLHGLQVEVIDPNAPTDERAYEQERGLNPDQGFLQRLRGAGNRRR